MNTLEFLQQSYKRKTDKLSEFRNRYESEIYPEKIVFNLFYDLYALKEIWPLLETHFIDDLYDVSQIPKESLSILINKDYSNDDARLLQANNELWQKFDLFRLNVIHPILIELMKNNIPIGNIKYEDYQEIINKAKIDNSIIEEIEYEYIFYGLVIEMIMLWASYGHLGYDRITASIATTGMVAGSFNFTNLEKTMDSFSSVAAVMIPNFIS